MAIGRRGIMATAILAAPSLAQAQAWPARQITLVVPFVPGGLPDSNARYMAQRLSQRLGQPVVVDNRGGAGGNIGAEHAARAKPDGYTILFGTMGTHGSNPALYPNIGFHPQRDFVPVHALFADNNVAVVSASSPFQTLGALAQEARRNPGKLTFGSGGVGSGVHLAGALFATKAGIDLLHVPYRGTPAALADVAGGRIDLIFDYLVTSMPMIQGGQLRALAGTGKGRFSRLPDVPTVAEAGFPDAELDVWSGLFVPAGTPGEITARLAAETEDILADEESIRWAARTDSGRMLGVREDRFAAFVASELRRWREIVEITGAKL